MGAITPFELFTGKRPRVDQLRVFGCDVYKLLDHQKLPASAPRKRLIYIGHSADRVGYRCFDPESYQISTEFELIFDEESSKRRIHALRQHDVMRELQRRGGDLKDAPVVIDEWTTSDKESRNSDIIRRLYAPAACPDEGGGGHDGLSHTTDDVDRAECEAQARNSPSTAPSVSTRAKGTDAGICSKQGETDISQVRTQRSSKVPIRGSSSVEWATDLLSPDRSLLSPPDPIPEAGVSPSALGDEHAENEKNFPNIEKKKHQSKCRVQSGRIPLQVSPPSNAHRSLKRIQLNEQDLGETLAGDIAAEVFGPLTQEALELQRKLTSFDPNCPMRPLRLLPIGIAEKDTAEFKKFRRASLEHDYPIQFVSNPKDPKSDSYKRYNTYSQANTLREVLELSTRGKSERKRQESRNTAMRDITWDALRGYIIWPQHECTSPHHYVNANDIAKAAHTHNLAALWSEAELEEERAKAKEEHRIAMLAAIEDIESQRRMQLGEEIIGDMMIMKEFGDELISLAAMSFQEQVGSLWPNTIDGYNSGHKLRDIINASALVENLFLEDIPTPKSFKDAISESNPDRDKWLASMKKERATLESRGTYELVPRSAMKGRKAIGCRYVYKVKRNLDKTIQYKSRLVAQGFSQREGVDYNISDVYAGVISYSSMRFLLSLACQKGYLLSQSDITGAYLQSYLNEELFMEVPPDMRINGKAPKNADGEEMVVKLKRGLYGLVQGGGLWSQTFKNFLLSSKDGKTTARVHLNPETDEHELFTGRPANVGNGEIDLSKCKNDEDYDMGFHELSADSSVYRKQFILNGKLEEIFLGQYVDDLIIVASSEEARLYFMKRLEHRFPVNPNSTGIIEGQKRGHILSMDVIYDRSKGKLQLNQTEAIEALARKWRCDTLHPRSLPLSSSTQLPKLEKATVSTRDYLSIVGSVLHIAGVSRPDVSFAVGVLARHSATPGEEHMKAAIDLIRYLYSTKHLCIQYFRCSNGGNKPEVFEKNSPPFEKPLAERLLASVPDGTTCPDIYVDADMAGDKATHRSTSGMVTMMNGGPISWYSRLQRLTAQSSAESEVLAVIDSMKEALHMKLLAEEAGLRPRSEPITIWEDNMACILLGEKLKHSRQTRHFAIRLRFMYENVSNRTIQFAKIDSKDQLADGFTKQLSQHPFVEWRSKLLTATDM
jgi:hypothetical protein